jgi:oligopeptidase B
MTKSSQATPHPPAIEARATQHIVHGVTLGDDYAWLKAENWKEVLRDPSQLPGSIRAVLDAENEYSSAVLAPMEECRTALVKEMRGRIKEDDAEVPRPDGKYFYYTRHATGGQHPLICRSETMGGAETILLDGNQAAEGKDFFDIGGAHHAPDHERLAWSIDAAGSEYYEIRIRNLALGVDELQAVADTDGSMVWMADSQGFYYVRVDENHRACEIFRHRLGADTPGDVLVFAEHDPRWFLTIRRAQSGTHAIIKVSDHDSSECYLLDLADPGARPVLIEPRAPGVHMDVEPLGGRIFICTNAGGAEDFKIVSAPLATPAQAFWAEEVPHCQGRLILTFSVFPDYLVRLEREAGLPRIMVRPLSGGEDYAIGFDEESYHLSLDDRLEFDTEILRFHYSSMTTPRETYDYDLKTRERVLRKRQNVPSGHDPSHYVTRRLMALAPDGETVPVSILHRAGLPLDGSAPLLLYGYGAYGSSIPAAFSTNRLSLVDRGFVYAIAHIRGGTDKGWRWYLDGKLANKPNTFSDFLAVARHLASEHYTSPGRIIAHGGSAGGMLMGAIVNLAPELFAGIIADVPFVDVLNTMLDADLPLTPPEWLEWGNPIADEAAFAAIRSYSPYDNIEPKAYPPILALGGLTDPRVTYWEPLKWVARLRAFMTGGGPILLKTNMGAGHAGASGRFDRLEEIALEYAFALACAEGAFAAGP